MAELILASDPEKRERDRYAHEAWGQRLSVAEFVAREERLRTHPWARDNMQTWLYVENGRVLSSCETFRMDSFADGVAGSSFGVASVYTELELRGRGYAGQMMQRLPTAGFQAGILFSDVGDYYARFGWRAVSPFERVIQPGGQSAAIRLCTIELDAIYSRLDLPRARFCVWASPAQLDWHRERERAYAELFGRDTLPYVGAKTGGGVIAWAADFKNDKLLILHLQADSADDVRSLVGAAQAEAAAARLQKVICWDVLAPWPEDLGETSARSDSLPMVLPIVDGSESWSFVPRALWI